MEGLRRRIGSGSPAMLAAMLLIVSVLVVRVPEVSALRYIVGSNMGWTTDVNYTSWAQDKDFYNGDWLFFVYDRHQMNVLEVNKTDYETCNSDNPLHNWTCGAGRDVVPLNMTRPYYFISGKGLCSGGMKLAISVENPPPPPSTASPLNAKNSVPISTYNSHISVETPPLLPSVIRAVWEAFLFIRSKSQQFFN